MPSAKSSQIVGIAGVCAIFAAYVGAYYGTVTPLPHTTSFPHTTRILEWYSLPGDYPGSPRAMKFEAWAEPLFRPIHWLDRRIRLRTWNP